MLTNLKTLLERFANSTSFDDVTDAVNQIYRDAEQDPELKNWFSSMNRFVRRCLKEQGYILQDDSNAEWNKLYDHGQFLLRDRYRTRPSPSR
jgi:recombinational DNA repair protein (RecF pathway)